MIPQVLGCQNCGNPVCLAEGQFIVQCPYCREKFYYPNPTLPVVVLKPRIKVNEAKLLILKALRAKEIDPFFLSHSYFEKATLFFIPFFEVRGVRAGKMKKDQPIARPTAGPEAVRPPTTAGPGIRQNMETEFICNSFQYLERANDIRDLGIGFIDISVVEDTILNSEQMEFDPTAMRRVGVLLPITSNRPCQQESEHPALPIIEFYVRVLYFPVWEVGYSYEGILFKSYLEAVNGRIMKIQAIKNGKRNLLMALLGAFALGTLISKSLLLGFQTLAIAPLVLVTLALMAGTAFLVFFPYFWQLFAFKEIIEKRPKITDSYPINYSENRFIRFTNRLLARVIRFLGIVQKNVSPD